jgi:hypothetical protein
MRGVARTREERLDSSAIIGGWKPGAPQSFCVFDQGGAYFLSAALQLSVTMIGLGTDASGKFTRNRWPSLVTA